MSAADVLPFPTTDAEYEACGFHEKDDPACVCPEKALVGYREMLADVLRCTAHITDRGIRAAYIIKDLELRGLRLSEDAA